VTAPTVVAVDAMVDLAATLSQVEDWLRWCTPRTDEGANRLDAGAAAAAALAGALRRSTGTVVTSGGVELAPVCVLPGGVSSMASAVQAAAVETDEPGPSGGAGALAVLHRCCRRAGDPESRLLAELALRTPGDQPLVVGGSGVLTYRRLVVATILDPLETYAALPPPPDPTLVNRDQLVTLDSQSPAAHRTRNASTAARDRRRWTSAPGADWRTAATSAGRLRHRQVASHHQNPARSRERRNARHAQRATGRSSTTTVSAREWLWNVV